MCCFDAISDPSALKQWFRSPDGATGSGLSLPSGQPDDKLRDIRGGGGPAFRLSLSLAGRRPGWLNAGYSGPNPSVLDGHTSDVVTFELPANGLCLVFLYAGETRAVERLVRRHHRLGEGARML